MTDQFLMGFVLTVGCYLAARGLQILGTILVLLGFPAVLDQAADFFAAALAVADLTLWIAVLALAVDHYLARSSGGR